MPDIQSIRPIASASNEFALALYGRLAESPGNLIFSPFSVAAALGMASAGARGETAAQMQRVLGFAPRPEEAHREFGANIAALNGKSGGPFELNIANSIWSQEGAPLMPEFLDRVRKEYFGDVKAVDFSGDPGSARAEINRWVEEKTRKRIRELVGPGVFNPLTRLILANAIYFKGYWEEQFPEVFSQLQPFFLEGDRSVEAPLMYVEEEAGHVEAKGAQAIELRYQGGDLTMLVVLPDRKDGLRDLERGLSGKSLNALTSGLRMRKVEIFLPRFRMEPEAIDLTRKLEESGMPLAFDESRADFSGINGTPPGQADSLYVSTVVHKAMVEVNEKGTEAAAATEMRQLSRSASIMPVPVFRADHPFLFAIRDRRSGAILFLGRVADPTRN